MLGKLYLCSRVSPVLLLFPSFWQKRLHEAAEECDEVDEDGWLLKVIPERIEHTLYSPVPGLPATGLSGFLIGGELTT